MTITDSADPGRPFEIIRGDRHAKAALAPAAHGERHFIQIVPCEIGPAAAQHPILLNKRHDTGRFYLGAMTGFQPGENLFTVDGRYVGYRALDVEREGFFLVEGEVAFDPRSSRLQAGGDPLFENDGTPAPALHRMRAVLEQFGSGLNDADGFVDALLSLNLIEPIDIDLAFDDGVALSLTGLYTISLDALQRLDDRAILALFRCGYLQLAYAMQGSLRQIAIMARRRNDRL